MRFLIFMMMALTLVRCTDTETFLPNPAPATFKASTFVEVTDVNGLPLEGVRIQLGQVEGYTDEEGLLYLKDVAMHPSTYLTAQRVGYFHGSRRFYATKKQTHFIRLILLPETMAGTIESDAGGIVKISDGVKLNFPSHAIVDKNGKAYDGTVSVFGQPLMADDPELSYKMPGDLIGLTNEGSQQALASLGMAVIELRSAGGELLQVKSGSKVELRIDVPPTMMSTAPGTIPMWYFDEELGIWKEEGVASLVGNAYVAQVGHFSYWNCDASFPLVKWGATFVFEDGSPASQVSVCITILELNTKRCALTDEDGIVCGAVAANELLLMEVMSPCGDVIYAQQIGPFTDTTMLGPITIPNSSVSLTAVSGFAVNCAGDPVTNGFVKVKVGVHNFFAVLDEVTGAFSLTAMNCEESDISISVVDETAFKKSLQLAYSYAPVIDAGTITVCETITEFIDLEVVGLPGHYFFYFPSAGTPNGFLTIQASDSSNTSKYFYVAVNATDVGIFPASGVEIGVKLPNGDRAWARGDGMEVTITYFGGPGDYIIGSLTGTWHTGPNGQGGPDYPLVGTFSVLRE